MGERALLGRLSLCGGPVSSFRPLFLPRRALDRPAPPRQTVRRLGAAAAFLVLLAGLGCSEDPSAPPGGGRSALGVFVVPRGAPGSDPLLVKAYSDIERGAFAWGQAEFDWSELEPRLGVYTWTRLDDHVRQSLRTRIPVSVVVRLVDGSRLGGMPEDLRGQDLGSVNVRVRFARFIEDLVVRSQGQLSHLWIGRAVDERLDAHPGEREPFRELFRAARDSLRVHEADLPVGMSFRYDGTPVSPAVDQLLPELDRLGWIVLPLDETYLPAPAPDEAVARVVEAVNWRTHVPVVLSEVGYRRGADAADADRFLAGLLAFLEEPPPHLEGATWFGLYDWQAAAARERAILVHPEDVEAQSAHAAWLRASGLGEANGTPTALWLRAFEWNQRER